jgi:hypothetical protein
MREYQRHIGKALALGRAYDDLQQVVGMELPSGSTLTVTCTRKPKEAPHDPGQVHYDGGVLTVATDSDSPRLPLISYSVPTVPESAEDRINTKILELRNIIQQTQDVTKQLQNQVSAIPRESTKLCYVEWFGHYKTFVPMGPPATPGACQAMAEYLLNVPRNQMDGVARNFFLNCELPDGSISPGAALGGSLPPNNSCHW